MRRILLFKVSLDLVRQFLSISSVFTLYWDLIHDWEHVEKEILLEIKLLS